MKKLLMVLMLAALTTAAQAQAAAPAPSQPQPAQQRKVIQDPTEYNAYIAALNATDPTQQAQLMESYLATYPNSVMKIDGLEILLRAYQKAGDTAHVQSTSQRLLQADPKNLTALALLSYLDRAQGQAGGANASASLQQAGTLGARGLEVLKTAAKPQGYTDAQWASKVNSLRIIFLGSVGHAALEAKDYATAQADLKQVVALQPNDVNSIYLLALAYLSPQPPVVDGLFWIAKAAASAPQLLPYAKNQYERYHGSDDGFDALVASAKTATTIPAGFTVTPAPSPADQAAALLQKSTPDKLSFADWQFILTNGSQDVTNQVWTAIKGKPVQLVAVVISAAPNALQMAGSVDDIQAKKSDFTLKLTKALPAAKLPKAGAELTVQGTPSAYSASADSFNMTFSDGVVIQGLSQVSGKPKKPSAGSYR